MDNIFIRSVSELYIPIEGISMVSYCTPLIADVWSWYESALMLSLSVNNQADVIVAFNSVSGYLNALLNIANP